MKKEKNIFWSFFASVKLALFTLFTLAVASVIGTLVPQNEAPSQYVELYGPGIAKVFIMLDFHNMYSSWWFTSMLILFSINLIVCTLERFPQIWKVVTLNNLETELSRLKKMSVRKSFSANASLETTEAAVMEILPSKGWDIQKAVLEGGTLFFSQKGAWTRLAVIIVHVSILIIFIGSLIGNFFGYKASVMIPEGSSTAVVYETNSKGSVIPLGFNVKCKSFSLSYYDTGSPKEFRSDLVVEKDRNVLVEKSIVVNDPLKYGGWTFYQASYQGLDGQFTVVVKNTTTGAEDLFGIVPRREMKWNAEKVSFGITNITGPDFNRKYRYKIWFSSPGAAPVEFWADGGNVVKVERPNATYEFMVKQRFATGLQVVKDPGVWTVYIGCILMIIGLFIIFFMSHRRVWVFVSKEEGSTSVLLSGNSNKNKIGFEKDVEKLMDSFTEHQALGLEDNEK